MARFGGLESEDIRTFFKYYLFPHIDSPTAVVSYKKNEVTPSEVESLIQKLKAECNCDVEHLSDIGALILTNIECEKEDIMKHLDDRMNINFIQHSG